MWRRVWIRLSYLVADDTIIIPNRRHIWRRFFTTSTHVHNERDTQSHPQSLLCVCARARSGSLSKQPVIVLIVSLRKTIRNNRLVIAIAEFETRDRPERVSSSSSLDLLLSSPLFCGFFSISSHFSPVLVAVFVPSRFLDIDSCTLVVVRDSMTRPLHTNFALSSTDIHCELVQSVGDQLQSSLKLNNILYLSFMIFLLVINWWNNFILCH